MKAPILVKAAPPIGFPMNAGQMGLRKVAVPTPPAALAASEPQRVKTEERAEYVATQDTRMAWGITDIETGPQATADLERIMPEFEADSRLVDPEKIKASIANKQEAWIAEAALSAITGRVVVIGFLLPEQEPSFIEGEEKAILEMYWKEVFLKTRKIIMHNRGFDGVFLIQRSIILGVELPFDPWDGRYLTNRFQCTMERWNFGLQSRGGSSLDTLSRVLGGPGKVEGFEGKDFHKLYANKKTRPKALNYLSQDLMETKRIARALRML